MEERIRSSAPVSADSSARVDMSEVARRFASRVAAKTISEIFFIYTLPKNHKKLRIFERIFNGPEIVIPVRENPVRHRR